MIRFLNLAAAYGELADELDLAIRQVARSGHYLRGPALHEFESEFSAFAEARHTVGVANGLDALTLALRALDVGPGDEVLVPSNTYIATWLAVTQVGAVVVPVEPHAHTLNLDAALLRSAITPRSRAIIPVHLYGQPADLDPILEIARAHGLRVLDDAAQCQGARYGGRRIGGLTDITAWSFYPGKNLGALGDGGAITTNDRELAERVRVLGNYGSSEKYVHPVKGTNSRLDDLQAAVLRVKLQHLDDWNGRRAAIAARYTAAFASTSLELQSVAPGCESVWHLYVVRTPQRDALRTYLADRGIETLVHYPIPPHLQGAYRDAGFRVGSFPIAERAHEQLLSLPIGPHLAAADVDAIIAAVRAWDQEGRAAALR